MRADSSLKSRMTVDELRKYRERKNRGKAASSEHALQVQCVKWFRMRFPGALIYAIPNGGFRTKTTAGLMRAEGVVSGISDLHIPIARHGYHSMYIEMKNGKAGVKLRRIDTRRNPAMIGCISAERLDAARHIFALRYVLN